MKGLGQRPCAPIYWIWLLIYALYFSGLCSTASRLVQSGSICTPVGILIVLLPGAILGWHMLSPTRMSWALSSALTFLFATAWIWTTAQLFVVLSTRAFNYGSFFSGAEFGAFAGSLVLLPGLVFLTYLTYRNKPVQMEKLQKG